MQEPFIPLELFTTGSSIIIVLVILYTILKYKKKISFIQELIKDKENGNYTAQDKEFLKETYNKTCHLKNKVVIIQKTSYPLFILVVGVFFIFYDVKEALTHVNIVVVTFLYLHILKTNITSYIRQMDLLA